MDVKVLGKALLDTLLGMGVVFTMLVLIAFIIWMFKFIPLLEEKFKKKNHTQAPIDTLIVQAAVQEVVEELTDDLELIAVITAAVHATMEAEGTPVPANGLVVRSIKKSNRSAWLKA